MKGDPPELGAAFGFGPDAPGDRYGRPRVEGRAAARAGSGPGGEGMPEAAPALERQHREPAEEAHPGRRRRLRDREPRPDLGRGEDEHLRVHDRGGEPERHDRGEGNPRVEHRRDERDDPARAEGGEGAEEGGERDGPERAAGEHPRHQPVGAARGRERRDRDREGEEGGDGDEGLEDEAGAREEPRGVGRPEDEERGQEGEHHPVAGRGPKAGEGLPERERGHDRLRRFPDEAAAGRGLMRRPRPRPGASPRPHSTPR